MKSSSASDCFKRQVFKQTCQDFNLPYLETAYLNIIGRNEAGVKEILCTSYGDAMDYPVFRQQWKQTYLNIVENQAIPVKDGVIELLQWLQQQHVPMVVATSTNKQLALKKLELAGLNSFFSTVTAGDEVSKGKPDPEIYLLTAKRLNVKPEQCLAFEDSNNGITAAIAANMQAFQIIDLVEPSDEVKTFGHHILSSMHEALALLKQQA
ncbi:HAD family hydrolase [Photobacterium leiognathi]|uniref:Phosphatase n=1 Tax=Photobacterium leiognathi TaxID=553611 RepID=A0A2T3MEB0_PHOLE|nr:HAD family phosphatase [Photobacterium leiognathi]PSV91952.1 phosphatase [Photobacterium leiognathi]